MSREQVQLRRRCLALAAGLVCIGASAQAAAAPAPLAWPALRLLDGRTLAPDHWHGAPAIVVFWATWCAYCKRHNARLDRIHAALDGRGPRVLAVAVNGDASSVAQTVRVQRWRFPVTVDDGSLRPLFTERRTVPMTCVVSKQGVVTQRIPGEMADGDLQDLALSLAV